MASEADKQEAGVARSENTSLPGKQVLQNPATDERGSSVEVLEGKAGAPSAEQLLAQSGFLVGTNSRV